MVSQRQARPVAAEALQLAASIALLALVNGSQHRSNCRDQRLRAWQHGAPLPHYLVQRSQAAGKRFITAPPADSRTATPSATGRSLPVHITRREFALGTGALTLTGVGALI